MRLIDSDNSIGPVDAASAIFRAEVNLHEGNHGEAHVCLKKHLGTNSDSQLFCQNLKAKKSSMQKFHGIDKLQEVIGSVQQTAAFSIAKFIVSSMLQNVVFCWDLVKDISLLYYYFLFIDLSKFYSFDSQVVVILLLSICIPNILNIILLLTENMDSVPPILIGVLVPLVFLSVSVTNYVLNKIQFIKEWRQRYQIEPHSRNERAKLESLSILKKQESQLTILNSKLKITEGIFESSIQALVLMITVAIILRYIYFITI